MNFWKFVNQMGLAQWSNQIELINVVNTNERE